jgi:integrase
MSKKKPAKIVIEYSDEERTLKVPSSPIPEESYNRFKYKLEEISRDYGKRNLMIFYVGVGTGYRSQDIVDLTIGEVHEALENEKFVIQEKKQYNSWVRHMIDNPGSKKKPPPKREVAIKSKLKKLLREYIKNKKKSEYAFPSNKGNGNENITSKSYSNILARVGLELDIKNISGHSMRKTYACRLWEAKKDLNYVRIALGHLSIETTKVYLGLNNQIKETAASIADDKL